MEINQSVNSKVQFEIFFFSQLNILKVLQKDIQKEVLLGKTDKGIAFCNINPLQQVLSTLNTQGQQQDSKTTSNQTLSNQQTVEIQIYIENITEPLEFTLSQIVTEQQQQQSNIPVKFQYSYYKKEIEIIETLQLSDPVIVSTDIGGTLVGNSLGLERFNRLYIKYYYFSPKSYLIYNSGRAMHSYLRTKLENDLIQPDYFVSRCGVMIFSNNNGEFIQDDDWAGKVIVNWDYETIIQKMGQLSWLKLKTHETDQNLCVKFFCDNEIFHNNEQQFYEQLKELKEMKLQFENIVRTKTNKKSIDFIPISTNKGQALTHLVSNHLNTSMKNVYAFGDTMNDTAMLKIAGTGVLVKNSMPDVLQWMDQQKLQDIKDNFQQNLSTSSSHDGSMNQGGNNIELQQQVKDPQNLLYQSQGEMAQALFDTMNEVKENIKQINIDKFKFEQTA